MKRFSDGYAIIEDKIKLFLGTDTYIDEFQIMEISNKEIFASSSDEDFEKSLQMIDKSNEQKS